MDYEAEILQFISCSHAVYVQAELRRWCCGLQDPLVSRISRKSIDVLKLHFKDDMTRADWQLVVKLKKAFQID